MNVSPGDRAEFGEGAHLVMIDQAGLVLIADGFYPIRVEGLLFPWPLGFAEGVKVVAIPHV